MAFIPLLDSVRVAVEQDLDGQLVLNIYYVHKATPIITADLTTIATIFKDWWIASMAPNLSSDISLTKVTATDISVEFGNQVSLTTDLPAPGEVLSQAASNNIAMCVTRYSLFTGRSNRGRSYYAGLAEVHINNNTIAPTQQGAIVTAQGQLSLDLQAGGYAWVIASFVSGGVPRVTGLQHGVASFAGNNRVDTQRRRLPGTGS